DQPSFGRRAGRGAKEKGPRRRPPDRHQIPAEDGHSQLPPAPRLDQSRRRRPACSSPRPQRPRLSPARRRPLFVGRSRASSLKGATAGLPSSASPPNYFSNSAQTVRNYRPLFAPKSN